MNQYKLGGRREGLSDICAITPQLLYCTEVLIIFTHLARIIQLFISLRNINCVSNLIRIYQGEMLLIHLYLGLNILVNFYIQYSYFRDCNEMCCWIFLKLEIWTVF